jgi:hypothetical protein
MIPTGHPSARETIIGDTTTRMVVVAIRVTASKGGLLVATLIAPERLGDVTLVKRLMSCPSIWSTNYVGRRFAGHSLRDGLQLLRSRIPSDAGSELRLNLVHRELLRWRNR